MKNPLISWIGFIKQICQTIHFLMIIYAMTQQVLIVREGNEVIVTVMLTPIACNPIYNSKVLTFPNINQHAYKY